MTRPSGSRHLEATIVAFRQQQHSCAGPMLVKHFVVLIFIFVSSATCHVLLLLLL